MTDNAAGAVVNDWRRHSAPEGVTLRGEYGWLRPLASVDFGDLYTATHADGNADRWTYMADGPFPTQAALGSFLASAITNPQVVQFVAGRNGHPAEGVVSLMRIDTDNGSVEVGSIVYGAQLAKSTAATEIMYLLARYVFDDLGYRRYEWKCDSLNKASRRAAERLGFRYEGTFRKHLIRKGHNRDTAWYAMTDDDWPSARSALLKWLAPENFHDGKQCTRLQDLRNNTA